MRIIIAGGRDFKDYGYLKRKVVETFGVLSEKGYIRYNNGITEITIVSGKAKGADELGEKFTKEFQSEFIKLSLKEIPANGDGLNVEMIKYANKSPILGVLIAFWNGTSKYTESVIDLANKYNMKTFIYNY